MGEQKSGLTKEEQLNALAQFVDDWAIKKDRNVKGAFTTGEYVTYRLNQIFTPAGWSFTILDGPQVVEINEANAYVRLVGRLAVRFADGSEAHQDDIGIWPLRATKAENGGTLETTAAERYETAEKAARTDCLKNAARNLGVCFAPMTDLELQEAIKRENYRSQNGGEKRSVARDAAELFGDSELGRAVSKYSSRQPLEAGFERLVRETNDELGQRGFETRTKEQLKRALESLGYTGYRASLHDQMLSRLIARIEQESLDSEVPS